jgi:TolA-binding protein
MLILRCLCFLLFLLLWSSGPELVAAGAREERAYTQAVTAFDEANWDRAQAQFAQFTQKYSGSTNVPEAVLLESVALFNLKRFDATVALLNNVTNLASAKSVNLADQYVYWIAEAYYASGQYQPAADSFISLTKAYPKSNLRLRSLIEAATALAALHNWAQVAALLEAPAGIFESARQQNPADEYVIRGELLIAQARLQLNHAASSLALLNTREPPAIKLPDLGWAWGLLRFQENTNLSNLEAALHDTTNLVFVATAQSNQTNRADAIAFQADLMEKSGRLADALAVYQQNLGPDVPAAQQRQAILRIAQLAIQLNQLTEAEHALEHFLVQYTNSPDLDLVLLNLGELHLRNYLLPSATSNDVDQAQEWFGEIINNFSASPFVGKAYLDHGWCNWLNWLSQKMPGSLTNSLTDFSLAAAKLTSPEDQSVAHFKMGDALLALGDFAAAADNYQIVLQMAVTEPAVEKGLAEQALYQILRAQILQTNLTGANQAFLQLQKQFPLGNTAQSNLLMYGESLPPPNQARKLFETYKSSFTNSPLLPQLQLAIARTYEREHHWSQAIYNYTGWLTLYPTNYLRPQVDYALANATYQTGDESAALLLFTNFVAQYPTNDLTPLAQWWVADDYYRQANWAEAERNYQLVYQTLARPNSPLFYEARLMAGRAALGRGGYKDATNYFTGLLTLVNTTTNYPPGMEVQARLAYGNALLQIDSADSNNPFANIQLATNVFGELAPTNEAGIMALGLIAKCDFQMGDYLSATNNYMRAANSEFASASVRSQARVGLGLTLEKLAQQDSGSASTNLQKRALDQYLDVFDTQFGENDSFWVEKAGLLALPLIQNLGVADSNKFIDRLEQLFPQLKDSLEKKRPVLPTANRAESGK